MEFTSFRRTLYFSGRRYSVVGNRVVTPEFSATVHNLFVGTGEMVRLPDTPITQSHQYAKTVIRFHRYSIPTRTRVRM